MVLPFDATPVRTLGKSVRSFEKSVEPAQHLSYSLRRDGADFGGLTRPPVEAIDLIFEDDGFL